MKFKLLVTSLLFCIFFAVGGYLSYASDATNVYFFYGQGCPHCAKEHEFLSSLVERDKSIKLNLFEVWYNKDNQQLLIDAGTKLGVEVNGVPFLVVGDKYLVGYLSDDTTGKEIKKIIEDNKRNGCFDIFKPKETGIIPESMETPSVIETNNAESKPAEEECAPSEESSKPILPKFMNLDMGKLSLPVLTVVLGFLDGFNPCAMWTLLFLISLLLNMQNKKKMWILGIAFIASSAFVYFLFMVAWLKLFQFIGLIFWVRAFIAVIAIVGGLASLKKFLDKDSSGCDVVGAEKKRTVFDKLGKVTSNKSFTLALVGVVGLAFAVNLVELVCSAGLPAVYTQVLALNNLSNIQYYMYILLYILFFMLDDLFVFFVAMVTFQLTGITTKYVKYSRLVGGLLMIAIGVLLLVKPEILMFS